MTSLLVDTFQGETYVFADGMVTQGDKVVSNSYVKAIRLHDGKVMAFAGLLGSLEIAHRLYLENKLCVDNFSEFDGSCTILVVDKDSVVVHTIWESASKETRTGYTMVHDTGSMPLFVGSGEAALTGAYFALDIDKSDTQGAYMLRVIRAFEAHAKRLSSVGKLVTTIKV